MISCREAIALIFIAIALLISLKSMHPKKNDENATHYVHWNSGIANRFIATDLITCNHAATQWRKKGADVECKPLENH